MYESHFKLDQTPFSIAPDPEFLYLSDGHQEALAHLMYGFSHGGFVLITGEVGTGKTTLLRNLVKQTPEALDVAFVLNPRLTVRELLETLCDELGAGHPPGTNPSVKQYIDVLNRHLLATHQAGRGTVVIIDEAQNLSPAVLEQIRLLTNLETDKKKLLRIILLGQPELADLLSRTELRQLAQRITARYHLRGLSRADTYAYVAHRLSRAGGTPELFSRGALRRLYGISGGIPRVINLVADRALLGAYVEGRHRVNRALVNRAAAEVLGRPRPLRRWIAGGLIAATATGVASAFLLLPGATGTGKAPVAGGQQAQVAAAPVGAADGLRSGPEAASGRASADADARAQLTDESAAARDAGSGDTGGAPASKERDAPAAAPGSLRVPELATAPATAPDAAPGSARAMLQRPAMAAFRSQRLAYQAVFERWGADLSAWNSATIPCNFAPSLGLQCLSRAGSWSDIRRLNLPVVLELWGRESTPFYGAVVRMVDDEVVLRLGGDSYTVTPADLRDVWFGSFVVLWRMPPDYHGNLERGDRHPSVRWLRRQLESLGMATADSNHAATFDASLQDAVQSFQREEQLVADGIVGPATWIRLGARLDLPAPKLDG